MSGVGEASVSLNSFYGRAAVKASRPQQRSSRQSATCLALVESGASDQGRLSADGDCEDFGHGRTCTDTASDDRIRLKVVPSPMVMLRMTIAPRLIQTSRPMTMGALRRSESCIGRPGGRSLFESRMLAYSPSIVPEPIVLPDMGTR
jgi:hypothetical protein